MWRRGGEPGPAGRRTCRRRLPCLQWGRLPRSRRRRLPCPRRRHQAFVLAAVAEQNEDEQHHDDQRRDADAEPL